MKIPFKAHHSKEGQNVIEYLLLMVTCILVVLVFLSPSGLFRQGIENTVNGTVNQLEDMANNVIFP